MRLRLAGIRVEPYVVVEDDEGYPFCLAVRSERADALAAALAIAQVADAAGFCWSGRRKGMTRQDSNMAVI